MRKLGPWKKRNRVIVAILMPVLIFTWFSGLCLSRVGPKRKSLKVKLGPVTSPQFQKTLSNPIVISLEELEKASN
jgi:hypothetical protein